MCDYTCDAVWNSDGHPCDAEELPVSPELVTRLKAWQAVYDAHDDDEDDGFDMIAFSALGLELAQEVKRQLPDWTVIYFDEARCGHNLAHALVEYEVHARMTDLLAGDVALRSDGGGEPEPS